MDITRLSHTVGSPHGDDNSSNFDAFTRQLNISGHYQMAFTPFKADNQVIKHDEESKESDQNSSIQ
jgi:hypothetical protein